MPTFFNAQAGGRRVGAIALALVLVYIVWGTTYFAIGIAVPSCSTPTNEAAPAATPN